MEDKIIMSQKEFNRMNILTKVLEGKLKQVDAANILHGIPTELFKMPERLALLLL